MIGLAWYDILNHKYQINHHLPKSSIIIGIATGKVEIAELVIPDELRAGKQLLSKEALSITAQTIQKGVATEDLTEALDIVYKGFGEISRSEAARDRISDFFERRKPEFKK